MDSQGRARRATFALDPLAIALGQRDESLRRRDGSFRRLRHADQEEREPRFPVAVPAYAVEQRSDSDDCVPSICEDRTASLRT